MPEVKIKPPEIGARKLLEGVRRSRGFYIYGVQNPKVSPTEAAVSQADAWHAKVSAAETKAKWVENRRAAGDETWLAGILGKGADRWLPGVEFGIGKYYAFAEEFYPYVAAGLGKVYSIQKRTLDDSIRRAAEMIKHNAAFKRKKRAFTLDELNSLKAKVEGVPLPG